MAVMTLSGGYIMAMSLAGDPTMISPLSLNRMTEGVVSSCSKFFSTTGFPSSSIYARHE
jgi:hypothetical protein